MVAHHASVQPKALFCFRSDTETENGQYFLAITGINLGLWLFIFELFSMGYDRYLLFDGLFESADLSVWVSLDKDKDKYLFQRVVA